MEQLASAGTIRLTAATANLADQFVDLKSLGQVPVKGLSQPIRGIRSAWGPVHPKHAAGIGQPWP